MTASQPQFTDMDMPTLEIKAICPIEIMRRSGNKQNSDTFTTEHDSEEYMRTSSVNTITPPSLADATEAESDSMSDGESTSRFYINSDLLSCLDDDLLHETNNQFDHLYPDDPNLPWHFCWVDDGMVAGMSAPVERFHWKAMKDENVGLVINLTESLIAPVPSDPCANCDFMSEYVESDLFHDVDGVNVLFLPVQDGNIPRWEQLEIFLKHAKATVEQGKKVAVHCQAGVGRTGTFLAVYIMDKYKCSAHEAIQRLRSVRPQSLQFHRELWQSQPFAQLPADEYVRNYFQERFIEVYYQKFILKGQPKQGYIGAPIDINDYLRSLVDAEINERLRVFEQVNAIQFDQQQDQSSCAACMHVLCLGPFPAQETPNNCL